MVWPTGIAVYSTQLPNGIIEADLAELQSLKAYHPNDKPILVYVGAEATLQTFTIDENGKAKDSRAHSYSNVSIHTTLSNLMATATAADPLLDV